MSDLAPLFTNVAEVLKNKTIEDLQDENNKLKEENNKLKKGRITVSYLNDDVHRGPVAEGFLDEATLVDLENLSDEEDYASLRAFAYRWRLDHGPYYVVKLNPLLRIEDIHEVDNFGFYVHLEGGIISSVVLGECWGIEYGHHPGCIHCCLSSVYTDDPNPPPPHVRLKSSSTDDIRIAFRHLIYKLVQRRRHSWDPNGDGQDYPPLVYPVMHGLPPEEQFRLNREFYERVNNAPPNSLKIELDRQSRGQPK